MLCVCLEQSVSIVGLIHLSCKLVRVLRADRCRSEHCACNLPTCLMCASDHASGVIKVPAPLLVASFYAPATA